MWPCEGYQYCPLTESKDFLEGQERRGPIRRDLDGEEVLDVQQKWKPPKNGRMKINFDAGLHVRNGIGGLGVMLRDPNSKFAAARSIPVEGIRDPLLAEAMAAREGLLFAAAMEVRELYTTVLMLLLIY